MQSLDFLMGYFNPTSAGPVCLVISQKAVCSQDDQSVPGHLQARLPHSGRNKVYLKLRSGQSTAWAPPWLGCCTSAVPHCCRSQPSSSPSPSHRSQRQMLVSKRSQGQSHQGSEVPDALSFLRSQRLSPLSEFAQIWIFQPVMPCFFIIVIDAEWNKLGTSLAALGCHEDLS